MGSFGLFLFPLLLLLLQFYTKERERENHFFSRELLNKRGSAK